jgi:hypothetical protein
MPAEALTPVAEQGERLHLKRSLAVRRGAIS